MRTMGIFPGVCGNLATGEDQARSSLCMSGVNRASVSGRRSRCGAGFLLGDRPDSADGVGFISALCGRKIDKPVVARVTGIEKPISAWVETRACGSSGKSWTARNSLDISIEEESISET